MRFQLNKTPSATLRRIIFLLACLGVLVWSGWRHADTLHNRQQEKQIFAGTIFQGIKGFIGKQEFTGYYTDLSLDDESAAAAFAQAQLILAPVVLEFNRLDLPYVIFYTSSPGQALEKIAQEGLIPLKINQMGVVVARNPLPRKERTP
ncbi:MAG: hypothetical protein ACLFPX_04215 [Candidatus Omnitrophota bacterium]